MFIQDEKTQITDMSEDLSVILGQARSIGIQGVINPLNDEIRTRIIAMSETLLNMLAQVANGIDPSLFRGQIGNFSSTVQHLTNRIEIQRMGEEIEMLSQMDGE